MVGKRLTCYSVGVFCKTKNDPELYFLKFDRFSFGNLNVAKIYKRVLSTNILQEQKRGTCSKPEV